MTKKPDLKALRKQAEKERSNVEDNIIGGFLAIALLYGALKHFFG